VSKPEFGFSVEDDGEGGDRWNVSLPWRDDRWRIDRPGYFDDWSNKARALAALDAFIAEAQQARAALAAGQEYPPQENPR